MKPQGFKSEGKTDNERKLWIESEKDALAQVMQRHGIKREHKGTHLEHLDVLNFKKEQRAKEVAELEQRIEQLTPEVQNMEMLVAEFCQDPEKQLPEVASFESAKSYRSKIKPLFEKMANMIVVVHAAFSNLRREYIVLKTQYRSEIKRSQTLQERLDDKIYEVRTLKAKLKDLERVKKFFGKANVEQAIEIVKQQEKEAKQKKKLFSR